MIISLLIHIGVLQQQQQQLGSGGTVGSEMAKSTQKLTTLADDSLGDPQLKG